jgi:hypothetical protein
VGERLQHGVEHRRPLAPDQLRPGGCEPRLSECELVSRLREDRECLLGDLEQRGARLVASGILALLGGDPRQHDPGAQLPHLVFRLDRVRRRVPSRRGRCLEVAGQEERQAEVDPPLDRQIAVGEQSDGPGKEVLCGVDVVPT